MDSLFTGVILNFKKYLFLLLGPATAYGRLADPNRIKRHFLKMRISKQGEYSTILFCYEMKEVCEHNALKIEDKSAIGNMYT